jgi:putative endonuclease
MSRSPNPSDWSSRARGRWGEDRAVARFRSLGFDVVDRNWRSPERELPGELDVVARRGDLVVFCEVKARGLGGKAVWAVRAEKQARVRALAWAWLRVHSLVDAVDVRFDVVAIDGVRLEHYEAAF